jgi:hypothetical protein
MKLIIPKSEKPEKERVMLHVYKLGDGSWRVSPINECGPACYCLDKQSGDSVGREGICLEVEL